MGKEIYRYFKVLVSDVDQGVMTRAVNSSPYTLKLTNDEQYCLLKFLYNNIPIKLFTLGYAELSHEQMIEEVTNEEWQS